MHRVVTCPFHNLIHVDKGKFATFNHLKHKCFHCGLFFSSAVPCVGLEPVLPKPAVKMAAKQVVLSNVVLIQSVTCSAAAVKLDATGCTVSSKPMSALECCVCDAADGANMFCTKAASEYLAGYPAETLGSR